MTAAKFILIKQTNEPIIMKERVKITVIQPSFRVSL